jgi:hypothetical protein
VATFKLLDNVFDHAALTDDHFDRRRCENLHGFGAAVTCDDRLHAFGRDQTGRLDAGIGQSVHQWMTQDFFRWH